jgi:subtilisin family serine protease
MYFDGQGNPLPGGPVTRFKPDIAAPDGVNTTFFGVDISSDADAFPNFFGTSASAPHAVAVAALMLQANPGLTPAQVLETMRSTAIDIETPGPDTRAGQGLIDALAALEAVLPAPSLRLAMLGENANTNRVRVQLKDALTGL